MIQNLFTSPLGSQEKPREARKTAELHYRIYIILGWNTEK